MRYLLPLRLHRPGPQFCTPVEVHRPSFARRLPGRRTAAMALSSQGDRRHRAVVEGELWPVSSVTPKVSIPGEQAQSFEQRVGIDNSPGLRYDKDKSHKACL